MTNPIPELNKDFLGINNHVSRELADNNIQSLNNAIQKLKRSIPATTYLVNVLDI